MTMIKLLAGSAAIAAVAAAAPASAQYANPYAYGYSNPYYQQSYQQPYGYNQYAYGNTNAAAQRCSAAVQSRLYNRNGLAGVVASLLGANTQPRVVSITQVNPRRNNVRVTGLASSGRYVASPYGYGAYGSAGYGYQPDISFRCTVDYNGYVRDIDINRR